MSLQVSAHSHFFITDDRNLKMYETERGSGNSPEKVVVKKALGEDLEDKKNFVVHSEDSPRVATSKHCSV